MAERRFVCECRAESGKVSSEDLDVNVFGKQTDFFKCVFHHIWVSGSHQCVSAQSTGLHVENRIKRENVTVEKKT